MSLAVDREQLKAALARIATPKAMVTKIFDATSQKYGKSAVKVVCVDSEKLDTLRFSDAWVVHRLNPKPLIFTQINFQNEIIRNYRLAPMTTFRSARLGPWRSGRSKTFLPFPPVRSW